MLPLVQNGLAVLEADVSASKDPALAPEVLKALHRRRTMLLKGGRRGECRVQVSRPGLEP